MIVVIACIVAGILAAVDLVRSRGQDLGAWGLLVLCVGLLIAQGAFGKLT